MIYLDNAATTMHKPQTVLDAVLRAMTSTGNASRGAHGGALAASRLVYDAREKLAQFFGCSRADHVAFTANSTEALNIAIRGVFQTGDHVITTDLEHNSVLRPLYLLEEQGIIELSIVPADRLGRVDYGEFERIIRPNTRGIVCTHASNLTGNMLNLKKISAVTRKHGLLLIVDASQTAGSVPIQMEEMGIDILCFTGHKGLFGPQGTGGLCVREGVEVRPFKVGGSGIHSYSTAHPRVMPVCLEAGTLNTHGIAGLSAAVGFLNETGLRTIRDKELALARRFYEGVSRIKGVTLYGDYSNWEQRTAIVTLNIYDWDSAVTADELFETYGIAVRAGAHCAPRMHEAQGTRAQGAVRFSFSWFNTEEETDTAIAAVRELAE